MSLKLQMIVIAVAISFISSSALAYKNNGNGKGKNKGDLPPGLAKKANNGQALPPGWQKKLHKGDVLNNDIYSRGTVVVPLAKDGTISIRVEGSLIKLHEKTMKIINILAN